MPLSIWSSAKHSIHCVDAVHKAGQAYLSWQYRAARQFNWSILKDEPPAPRTKFSRHVSMRLGICVDCSLAAISFAAIGDMAHIHARGMVLVREKNSFEFGSQLRDACLHSEAAQACLFADAETGGRALVRVLRFELFFPCKLKGETFSYRRPIPVLGLLWPCPPLAVAPQTRGPGPAACSCISV